MITFIGNNANEKTVSDGGRLKMRLFVNLLKKEGHEVGVIDINGWKKHFVSIILKIKKAVKRGDNIVIMAGPKGCRVIIPLVTRFNKKHLSKIIFCPVGLGTVDYLLKDRSLSEIDGFVNCKDFLSIKDDKMKKCLSSFNYVCPENEIQEKLYKEYYSLTNIETIQNFRDIEIKEHLPISSDKCLKIIYASRVKEYKGIIELLEVINKINETDSIKLTLDIYGDNQLTEDNNEKFKSMLNENVRYNGIISTTDLQKKIRDYDLFCLPTKYYAEGTSGALVEALIAGTPCLVSSYSQVDTLIKDGINGYIFKIDNKEDLKAKLIYIVDHKNELQKISKNAQESAEKFTYKYNRDKFLRIMAGVK